MKNVMKKMMRVLCVLVCIIGMAAVHAAGVYADLYVTNNGDVKSIRVYADTGDTLIKAITSDALTDPHGIAIDAGYIYVADRDSNSILVFNLTDTEKVTPVKRIAGDTAKTGLNAPIGIAIYATKIYVANNGNNTVTAYDLSAINNVTTDISPTALPNISSNLNGPTGIAVNATNIYVANLNAPNTVSVFNLEGVYQKQISSGLDSPIGVAVDESFIYVANYAAPDISVFNIGTLERKAIIPGPTTTGVNGTYGIAVDAKYIYLADSASNSIRVFNLPLVENNDVVPLRTIEGLGGPVFIAKGPSTPPAAPSGLAADPVSPTRIDLVWTDNSSNETGFKIYRDTTLVTTTAAGATSYSDTGLDCNTTYRYTIKATNSGGDSAAAATMLGTITTSACTTPTAPSGLGATVISGTQINLAWTDNSNNETGFKIYRGTTLVTTTAAGVMSYNDTGLTCNMTYTYTVKATNSGGDSAAAATTPATITTSACTAAYSSKPPAGAIPAMNSTVGINPTTTLTVSETGTAAMNVSQITFGGTDSGKFSVTPNTFPVSIAASGTQAFTITCNASVAGTYSATMAVAHDAAGSPANYTLNCTVACTPATCIPGDVNGDDSVDLNDALHVLRILDGIPVDKINLNADVNGDHKIGLEELGYILQKVAGLRP